MSPAHAGGLQVERYIGSCLISAPNNRQYKKETQPQGRYQRYGGATAPALPPPEYQHYQRNRGGWTGLPLISMTTGGPRRGKKQDKPQEEQRSPLSRLAIHTQGAPLIQAGRQQNKARGYKPQPKSQSRPDAKEPKGSAKEQGADNLSVASDESSGNSENTLPRIIKPRKRRKKDRKPPAAAPSEPPPENSAIVTLKPYTPLCYETFDDKAEEEEKRREPPAFPFPEEKRETSCQCRYCDPVGVIWDVEQRCYSPYLTPPSPLAPPSPPPAPDARRSLQVSSEIVTSPNGHRDIEIKFFSSPVSPPSPLPVRSASVTPPWPDVCHYRHFTPEQ